MIPQPLNLATVCLSTQRVYEQLVHAVVAMVAIVETMRETITHI